MEVDQRDRERKWNSLLNPIERRTCQELAEKNIHTDAESLEWLDSELPNLKDASDFQIPSSQLDPEFKKLMHIGDSESIFLIFPAVTEKIENQTQPPQPQLQPNSPASTSAFRGQVWFTTAKFMAVRSDAAGLLFYTIALNNVRLGKTEEAHMREIIQKWLKSIQEGKTTVNGLSCLFSYDAVSEITVSNLGNSRRIGDVTFKNTSIPPAAYRVTFGRPVIPQRVWLANSFERGPVPVIFCKPYPCKPIIQEMLITKQQAAKDDEERVIISSFAQTKMFLDALRRRS